MCVSPKPTAELVIPVYQYAHLKFNLKIPIKFLTTHYQGFFPVAV